MDAGCLSWADDGLAFFDAFANFDAILRLDADAHIDAALHVAILHEGEATGDNHPEGGAIFALWLPETHGNPGARGDGQDPAGR